MARWAGKISPFAELYRLGAVCLFHLPLQREGSGGLRSKVGNVLHCMTFEIPQGDRRKEKYGLQLSTLSVTASSSLLEQGAVAEDS